MCCSTFGWANCSRPTVRILNVPFRISRLSRLTARAARPVEWPSRCVGREAEHRKIERQKTGTHKSPSGCGSLSMPVARADERGV